MYRKILISIALIISLNSLFAQEQRNIKAIEKTVKKIYPKLLEYTVNIENGGSGVLISEDGYILTASHIIRSLPGKKELSIRMSDGSLYKARPLGRSDFDDYALLKIESEKSFPFSKLGSSAKLAKDEACVLMGHPASYKQGRPAVLRVGFVKGFTQSGYLKTSAIMMPGDSGGPLFNLKGELIGINSYCWQDEKENFFAPVDKAKANWKKLTEGKVFNPISRDRQPFKPSALQEAKIKHCKFILQGGKASITNKLKAKINNTIHVYKLFNSKIDKRQLACATLISEEGIIVSKSSLINRDTVLCKAGDKYEKAIAIKRISDLDIVYLRLAAKDIPQSLNQKCSTPEVGDFLGTINADNEIIYSGVKSVKSRRIAKARKPAPYGILGIQFADAKGIIKAIHPKSGAYKSGLREGDKLLTINDEELSSRGIIAYMKKTFPYEQIYVTYQREGKLRECKLSLGSSSRNPMLTHPAFRLRTSQRKGDFQIAFTHDMPIKPNECGTPVINLNGELVGINIARQNRTCSFAIPIDVIMSKISHQ